VHLFEPFLARSGRFFGPFSAACMADIDPERGAAQPVGGGAASARQPRLRRSVAVRYVRGGECLLGSQVAFLKITPVLLLIPNLLYLFTSLGY
jgi:hypothetical protein